MAFTRVRSVGVGISVGQSAGNVAEVSGACSLSTACVSSVTGSVWGGEPPHAARITAVSAAPTGSSKDRMLAACRIAGAVSCGGGIWLPSHPDRQACSGSATSSPRDRLRRYSMAIGMTEARTTAISTISRLFFTNGMVPRK